MIRIKLLLCLLVLHVCEYSFAKQCDSCMLLRQCPEALDLTTNMTSAKSEKLVAAVCGTTYVNGKRLPMVCCSDFMDVSDRFAVSESDIESHKNIALLPERCGSADGDRIIGGLIANLYEFPWMVLVSHQTGNYNGKKFYEFHCGGTILNSRYVLTAAHCVVNTNIAGVRVGELNMRTRDDCQGEHPHHVCENHIQDIRVMKVILHKDFKIFPSIQNDIALLRVKKPMDFSFRNVAPVCLPISNHLRNISLGGRQGTVAGWGITEFGKESSVLRKVIIPIQNDYECRQYYDSNSETGSSDIKEKKICAGEIEKDSCKGDSGGPLMLEQEHKGSYRMIQFGIVSYGSGKCGSSSPGVYTDVRQYVKWILDNIEP